VVVVVVWAVVDVLVDVDEAGFMVVVVAFCVVVGVEEVVVDVSASTHSIRSTDAPQRVMLSSEVNWKRTDL